MNDSIVNEIMSDINKPERQKPQITESKKNTIKLETKNEYNKR